MDPDINSRNENTCPYKYMYMDVYSGITHNSQNMETIEMSMNSWFDKQNVVYPRNEILFSN